LSGRFMPEKPALEQRHNDLITDICVLADTFSNLLFYWV